jgi:hypothetical protein
MPSSRAGRPLGSKKPDEKKAQDAAEFEQKIEEAIRALRSTTGTMPRKTAVAKYVRIGGMSPAGSNTSLGTFNAKLKRLREPSEGLCKQKTGK